MPRGGFSRGKPVSLSDHWRKGCVGGVWSGRARCFGSGRSGSSICIIGRKGSSPGGNSIFSIPVAIDWNCATRPGTQACRSRASRNSPICDGSGSRGGPGVHRKTRAHTFLSWSVIRGRGHSAADDRGTSSGRVRLLQRPTARAINGGELYAALHVRDRCLPHGHTARRRGRRRT